MVIYKITKCIYHVCMYHPHTILHYPIDYDQADQQNKMPPSVLYT